MTVVISGCGAVWLACLHGVQEVLGSNPSTPTDFNKEALPLAW